MKIAMHAVNFSLEPDTRSRLEERVSTILSRFADRISNVRVRVEDVNGPKGGIDHHCQIEAHLRHGDAMHVEARDVDAPTAVDRAARRIQAKIRRDMAKRITHRRSTDRRTPPIE